MLDNPTPDYVLSVRNLTLRYDATPALDDISFDVKAGEMLAIIGPNGAGKSTLMQAVMGLIQPQAGTISIAGGGRRLGYVPQHQEVNWDFPVTVRDVVMMGLIRQIGWLRWPGRRHWRTVEEAVDRVGMLPFINRQIKALSGGQRQRVFVARALAQQADILLLDEPFAGVDVQAQSDLMNVLNVLHCEGLTILLSTHDLDLAFRRFDMVMALNHRLIAYGSASEMYSSEVLSALYGGKLAALRDGDEVVVFVDEHHCT